MLIGNGGREKQKILNDRGNPTHTLWRLNGRQVVAAGRGRMTNEIGSRPDENRSNQPKTHFVR